MPKKKHESKPTVTPEPSVPASDVVSDNRDEQNGAAANIVPEDVADIEAEPSKGTDGGDGGSSTSDAESDQQAVPEFKLEEVSDPLPEDSAEYETKRFEEGAKVITESLEARLTAKDYLGDTPFPSYKTPDGTVFNITTADDRFEAVSLDGTKRVASTLTDTIDEFYATLNEVCPAKVDPFTGQDVAARLQQGVQGGDPAPEIDAPVANVEPKVKVDLNYTAYINACSWFPAQINMIGGRIVDNSDTKEVHVLIHDRDDFRAEWSHLLLGPVEVAE